MFGSLSTDLQGIISSIGDHGDLIATSMNSQSELQNIQEAESKTNILSAVQAISSALTDGHSQISNAISEGHGKVADSVTSGHKKMTSAFTDGHEKLSTAVLNTNDAIDTMTGVMKVRITATDIRCF